MFIEKLQKGKYFPKPSRNWDNTLTGKLINYAENKDSIGYDKNLQRWYAPPAGKGYDTNQFGMGVDRNQTPRFKDFVKIDNQGREYLTVSAERYLRHLAIDNANNSANARYKYAQKVTNNPNGTVSPVNDASTVSAIYNLGSGYVARNLFENRKAMENLFKKDNSYLPFIYQYYKKKNRNDRIAKETEFISNYLKHGGSLNSDGRSFNFKNSNLVDNSKKIYNKRDMRKKLIKTDIPSKFNKVKKAQEGMKIYTDYDIAYNNNYNNIFSDLNIPYLNIPYSDSEQLSDQENEEPIQEPIKEDQAEKPLISTFKNYAPKINNIKGLEEFNKIYDEVETTNKDAKKYRQLLTKLAEKESGFNSAIKNKYAPAYGYFQFMQDGKTYNNIEHFANTDINTFLNNPKLQIQSAIKLAKQFEKSYTKEDLDLANKLGITKNGLIAGAWLAGNSGVRKFLKGEGNPSDKHWGGKGTNVKDRINLFNFKKGGAL